MTARPQVELPELPEPDCMLPAELMPVADEWYSQICERAGYVDRLTISGDLVEAIKAAIGEPRYTAAQVRELLAESEARAEGAVKLTDAQCDAIYDALDTWARELDSCDFGLPRYAGDGIEGGREVIRAALAQEAERDAGSA